MYTKYRDKAAEKLKQRGMSFDIVQFNQNNDESVVAQPTGLRSTITEDDRNELNQEASFMIVCTTIFKPDNSQYVRFNDELYKIVHVEDVSPTDVPIIYKIFVRGP